MKPFVIPHRALVARLLVVLAVASLVGACGASGASSSAAAGVAAPANDPAAVVKDAIAKAGAKDVAGLGTLACAGQADRIRDELGMSGDIGAGLDIPGLDTQALMDAVQLDMSQVAVGTPTVTGDTAQVPVSGSLNVTFDKAAIKPVLKQVMEQNGSPMTDQQLDALIDTFASTAQAVPLDESVRLVNEGGAWKICEEGTAAPSAS